MKTIMVSDFQIAPIMQRGRRPAAILRSIENIFKAEEKTKKFINHLKKTIDLWKHHSKTKQPSLRAGHSELAELPLLHSQKEEQKS